MQALRGASFSGMNVRVGGGDERSPGVSLEHGSVVPAARILVIEDNSADVFLLGRALDKQDGRFELICLADGDDALAFIRREGAYADATIPNLILVDLNLPKCDGEVILREIRQAKHLVGVPVCAWSSSQSRRDRDLLTELGVVRFITKPSGLDQFMEIGKILKDLLA
jgi:two-component system, chemotaxis family, response regulator Rcp1